MINKKPKKIEGFIYEYNDSLKRTGNVSGLVLLAGSAVCATFAVMAYAKDRTMDVKTFSYAVLALGIAAVLVLGGIFVFAGATNDKSEEFRRQKLNEESENIPPKTTELTEQPAQPAPSDKETGGVKAS